MEEIDVIQNLVVDIGMSAVTIIAILIVLYKFVKKFIEDMIESIITEKSNKNVEKYINDLNRKTIVYENLIKKELEFYEKTEDYISDIVVEIQDVQNYYLSYIQNEIKEEIEEDKKKSLKELLKILNKIPKYKKDIIMFGNYIDDVLEKNCSEFLCDLQDNSLKLSEKIINDKVEVNELKMIVDNTLKRSSSVMVLIRERYQNLSSSK